MMMRRLFCFSFALLAVSGGLAFGQISHDDPLTVPRMPLPEADAGYLKYLPYNAYPRELNLWGLEGKRFVRSEGVISPDKTRMAYSEVLFMPKDRQTISRMYLVHIPDLPLPPLERLPSEEVLYPEPAPSVDFRQYATRFDPEKSIKLRQAILSVGYEQVKPFDFRTLTVVDWSATGDRLLFKQRSGVLHVGLRTSDILVYNQKQGNVTIYPEVHRVIKHYWETQGNLPHIDTLVWDIEPLGWEPGSDSQVLLKAWAYDKKERKFLGVWRYDVDAERTMIVGMENVPVPVAANGWVAQPIPISPEPEGRRWFGRSTKPSSSATQTLPKTPTQPAGSTGVTGNEGS